MNETTGWVVIWRRADTDYPQMTSNIVDENMARKIADGTADQGHEVITVCPASALAKLPKPKRRKPSKLKLFVWEEFCPDYTSGLAVAIAETVHEAQDLIGRDYISDWGPVREFPLTEPRAFSVTGGG